MGAIGVIETYSSETIQGFQAYAVDQHVWTAFWEYIYTMPPYIISEDHLNASNQYHEGLVYSIDKWV